VNHVSNSRPPPTAELRRWRLHGHDELCSLRASLHQALSEIRTADGDDVAEISERVALVATELATNALQHGRPPTTVRLLRQDDDVVLDVADHNPGDAPLAATLTLAGQRGRGLPIVRAMSRDVGWYAQGDVKHVWASFTIEPGTAAVLVRER
jgi:serine/threonine-protein kinase RsbW